MSLFAATLITEGIQVRVCTSYLEDDSSPRHHHYVFAYQVEITNHTDEPVKLLSREWHITDGFGRRERVQGEGVVGKQPIIQPGETYTYMSGTHFQTLIGHMSGFYYMMRLSDKASLRIRIPGFSLVTPSLLN